MNFIFRTFLHLKLCIWCNFNKNKWYSHRRPIRGDYRERRLISGIITWLAQPLRHHESGSRVEISCLTHWTKKCTFENRPSKGRSGTSGLNFYLGHTGVKDTKVSLSKVECVFTMVIVSILIHAEFWQNDHREDAAHLRYY